MKKRKKTFDDDECASALKAIGEDTRLRILKALMDGEHSVGELSRALGVEHHFASRHLAILKREGLVVARRDAQKVYYSIGPKGRDRTIDLGCCQVHFA